MLSIIPLAISVGSSIELTAYHLLNYRKTACVMISVPLLFLIGFGYFWDTPQQLCSMAHKNKVKLNEQRFVATENLTIFVNISNRKPKNR